MTRGEKANRYDALQVAFKYTKERYQDRKSESEGRYKGNDPVSAYNKGMADAYGQIIDDIERWME